MNTMTKDIALGTMFIAGTWGFISGQFIISALLFASAAIFSNIALQTRHSD